MPTTLGGGFRYYPHLWRGTLRPGEVLRPRENSGLYFSGLGFHKGQMASLSISLSLSSSVPIFQAENRSRYTRRPLPNSQTGLREAERIPSLGWGPGHPSSWKIISRAGRPESSYTALQLGLRCVCNVRMYFLGGPLGPSLGSPEQHVRTIKPVCFF